MTTSFETLAWHDAEILKIEIDRHDPGNVDTVALKIKWRDGKIGDVVFEECFKAVLDLNFNVIARETILAAAVVPESPMIEEVRSKWETAGVKLDDIHCYRIETNSTGGLITIVATKFSQGAA